MPVWPEHAARRERAQCSFRRPLVRFFMPRDNDKDNASSRGRRDRGPAKGRSGKPRGPEKKFAKRGFGDKGGRDERPPRGDRDSRPFRRREDGDAPRRDFSDRSRFKRDDRGGERG